MVLEARPRPQQPATRARRHQLRSRHLEHGATGRAAHRRTPGPDLSDRIRGRACRRGQPIHVRADVASRSNRANPARIGSACAANRDSQPRTVEAGRPAAAQIRRHPQPAARASSVAQITATASTRRPRQNRGSSRCEWPQPAGLEQIARRGRIRSTVAAAWRTNRGAACPHRASRCPHCGHLSPPERN